MDQLWHAKQTAIRIFATIGVPLVFHSPSERTHQQGACIVVEIFLHWEVPREFRPGTYA
jgi:hypothetical protein